MRAHDKARNGHVLAADAEVGPADPAVLHQLAGDKFRRVDGNSKTDPLRRQNHRRIDAYDLAQGIDQGTAGVAGVERRVGLDHVVDQPSRFGAERATKGADDAGGDAVLKTVRIANGDGELADANFIRVAKLGCDQPSRGNSDYRKVGARVVTDQARVEAPSVAERG